MTDPDRALARKARRGDRQALVELYGRHRSRLLGFLIGQLRERDAAEEVFQEVWLKVLAGIEQYRTSRGPFRAWLFRVAANAAVDRMRRDAVRAGPELDAPAGDGEESERVVDGLASPEPSPERAGGSALLARELAAGLAELGERQHTAVLLRHQQGFAYRELARVLDVPEGTAKTLVHRGVLALRERLSEWNDG